MRVTVIHNVGAGSDDSPDAETLLRLLRAAGHTVRYQPSSERDWAAALDAPADLVAVAGGDGTVGRVAKKLIGRNIPLAPLPLGTANNIARTLGLCDVTLAEIVDGWDRAPRVRFDVGVAKGPWGSRYFVEAMGLGLFARTLPAADESKTLEALRDPQAKVDYALLMLRERLESCRAHPVRMRLDGRDFSGEYVLLEAMNMEFVGPNLYLAPEVAPADGRLDVVFVTDEECEKLQRTLSQWQAGVLARPDLTRLRASHVEIEWSGFDVHFDDEAWPDGGEAPPRATRIELTVERDALCLLGQPPS